VIRGEQGINTWFDAGANFHFRGSRLF